MAAVFASIFNSRWEDFYKSINSIWNYFLQSFVRMELELLSGFNHNRSSCTIQSGLAVKQSSQDPPTMSRLQWFCIQSSPERGAPHRYGGFRRQIPSLLNKKRTILKQRWLFHCYFFWSDGKYAISLMSLCSKWYCIQITWLLALGIFLGLEQNVVASPLLWIFEFLNFQQVRMGSIGC